MDDSLSFHGHRLLKNRIYAGEKISYDEPHGTMVMIARILTDFHSIDNPATPSIYRIVSHGLHLSTT
jgi:hypothetical protein